MDWKTFIISILGSGFVTAIVNGLMNHRTKIKAIKESGLYAKRAEVLDVLMKRLERLDRIMRDMVSPIQSDGSNEAEIKRRTDSSQAFNYFSGYFLRTRHYLPSKISEKLNKLINDYKDTFVKFTYEARIEGEKPDTKLWIDLHNNLMKDVQDSKEDLVKEFRKLIGVE